MDWMPFKPEKGMKVVWVDPSEVLGFNSRHALETDFIPEFGQDPMTVESVRETSYGPVVTLSRNGELFHLDGSVLGVGLIYLRPA